jgi:hypothetical protein
VYQKFCDILYLAHISAYVNDITLNFFLKMRRGKLYKTCIKKFLVSCCNGFSMIKINALHGSGMSHHAENM